MTQNKCSAACACQTVCEMADCEPNPTVRTVTAGNVCGSVCAPEVVEPDGIYATIHIPAQNYQAGFCPADALCKGTLFPELVSPYTRGC